MGLRENNIDSEETYKYQESGTYTGMWKRDLKEGSGKMCWSDGSSYDGAWKSDVRHGYGTIIMSDGTLYVGDWENDLYHGRGKLIISTMYKGIDGKPLKKIFEGWFTNGQTPTEGKITYSDGTKGIYIGGHV